MIIGYYIVEILVFLIPSPIALIEIPFNVLQVIVGGTIAMIATKTLKNSIEEIMHR
jgi:ABC-type microcin C transport system permease subunit YejB